MQAIQSVLSVVDRHQSQLANWADKPSIDYEAFVTMSTWLQTGFEVWLLRQQLRAVAQPNPPAELKDHFTKETYSRATAYSISKLRYSLIKTVFDQTFQYYLIKYHVYSAAWDFAGGWMNSVGLSQSRTITHSLLWVVALTAISALPSLPWSYYYHFILEEKYGFNKQTVRLWIMDQVKGYALGAVIGMPILAGFLKVIEWAGKGFVPFLMLFMLFIQLTLQIIYPTFIQPLFNKLTPLPEGDLRSRVNKLSAKLGFPLKHLYVIDGSKRSSHSNAYFYGLPWSKHIVIYDTLIEQSTPSEVEAVLGHELGHWYFSHPTKLLAIAQLHLLFTFTTFSLFIHNKSLFSSFHFDPRLAVSSPHGGSQPIMIGFMLYQLIFGPLDSVAQVLMHAQTRKYEYQADEFSVRLGQKEDLKAGLIKLHVKNLSAPHNSKIYSMYHHSHPTLPERLKAMEEYKVTKPLEFKSDKKDL